MPGGVDDVLLGRVAGIIRSQRVRHQSAAKGTDKIVGVALMQSEAGVQLEGDRLQICPAAGSGALRLWK
jgi:hypothetical protein